MDSTHAYISALVPAIRDVSTSNGDLKGVITKARTFSARAGSWIDLPRFFPFVNCDEGISAGQISRARVKLRDGACAHAGMCKVEDMRLFAELAYIICRCHGEGFPTWSGDLYISPWKGACGDSRKRGFSHYLVTEAPGLDCGIWEGDPLPAFEQGW